MAFDFLIVDRDLEARESDRLAIKSGACKGRIVRTPVDPQLLRDYAWHVSYYASCWDCGRSPWRCVCPDPDPEALADGPADCDPDGDPR